MRVVPGPDSALAVPPADVGRLDAGAVPGPPHDRASIIEQARSTRSRVADLRQRAEETRQRALTLMQETAALMLAVEQILRPMPRQELLGRYLPEWRALTCLVQYDVYHRYTADQHSLLAVEHMEALDRTRELEVEPVGQAVSLSLGPAAWR